MNFETNLRFFFGDSSSSTSVREHYQSSALVSTSAELLEYLANDPITNFSIKSQRFAPDTARMQSGGLSFSQIAENIVDQHNTNLFLNLPILNDSNYTSLIDTSYLEKVPDHIVTEIEMQE